MIDLVYSIGFFVVIKIGLLYVFVKRWFMYKKDKEIETECKEVKIE
jgi:hypothetical protein